MKKVEKNMIHPQFAFDKELFGRGKSFVSLSYSVMFCCPTM